MKTAALLCLAGITIACGPSPRAISAQVQRGRPAANAEPLAEAEALWAERLDQHKLEGAIAAWKRCVTIVDDDAATWLMLSRATYFLADGFLDLDHVDNEVVTHAFEDGAAFADRGLRALSPRYEQLRRGGADVDEAARQLGPEAAPYVYWWGLNAIRWADRKGWTAGLRVYKHVNRVMEQVERQDPGYDHAGADRYLGAFYAQAPGVAGGDVGKGHEYLLKALALAPTYLGNHVILAERYAQKVKDEQLFETTLRLVKDTPSAVLPDAIPEQEIAKRKARQLAPHLFETAAAK